MLASETLTVLFQYASDILGAGGSMLSAIPDKAPNVQFLNTDEGNIFFSFTQVFYAILVAGLADRRRSAVNHHCPLTDSIGNSKMRELLGRETCLLQIAS